MPRKAICKICECVMLDWQPYTEKGCVSHPRFNPDGSTSTCPNMGGDFALTDPEVTHVDD